MVRMVAIPPNLPEDSAGGCMPNLDSAQERLKQARAAAVKRTRSAEGPEWPKADAITLEDALTDLTLEMLEQGLRVSLGVTDGSADVWCRAGYPLECESARSGMVCFQTSSTAERALRKTALCLEEGPHAQGAWKPDRYAR